MKFLKGFGKNYFSFSAMTMYSTAQIIADIEVISKRTSFTNSNSKEEEEESPPDELLLELVSFPTSKKPCHCCYVFTLKTKIAIAVFKYIPRCPFYTTYFAFRRSGVHPPFLSL